MLEIQPQVSIL